jgi:hypothetical protein
MLLKKKALTDAGLFKYLFKFYLNLPFPIPLDGRDLFLFLLLPIGEPTLCIAHLNPMVEVDKFSSR